MPFFPWASALFGQRWSWQAVTDLFDSPERDLVIPARSSYISNPKMIIIFPTSAVIRISFRGTWRQDENMIHFADRMRIWSISLIHFHDVAGTPHNIAYTARWIMCSACCFDQLPLIHLKLGSYHEETKNPRTEETKNPRTEETKNEPARKNPKVREAKSKKCKKPENRNFGKLNFYSTDFKIARVQFNWACCTRVCAYMPTCV